MIGEFSLFELLNRYGINPNSIPLYKKDRILSHGEYKDIEYALTFLRTVLSIPAKRIENCPSILYSGVANIKKNYEFLGSHGFNVLKIKDFDILKLNDCLHILSTDPKKLEFNYNYIKDNYGEELLEEMTSSLSISNRLIRSIEEMSKGRLSKRGILSIAINYIGWNDSDRDYSRVVHEIERVIEVCLENDINCYDGGIIFQRSADEIRDLIKVCREFGISYHDSGVVFSKRAEEVRKIAVICEREGIPYK